MSDLNAATPPQNGSKQGADAPFSLSEPVQNADIGKKQLIGVDPGGKDSSSVAVFDLETQTIDAFTVTETDDKTTTDWVDYWTRHLGISREVLTAPVPDEHSYSAAAMRDNQRRFVIAQEKLLKGWTENLLSMTFKKTRKPFAQVRTSSARRRKHLRQRHRVLRMTMRAFLSKFNAKFDIPLLSEWKWGPTISATSRGTDPQVQNIPKQGAVDD